MVEFLGMLEGDMVFPQRMEVAILGPISGSDRVNWNNVQCPQRFFPW